MMRSVSGPCLAVINDDASPFLRMKRLLHHYKPATAVPALSRGGSRDACCAVAGVSGYSGGVSQTPRRIGDYAFLSDCHTAALVREGAVEWLCFPAFDSPSVLASILDPERGGSFAIAPSQSSKISRAYVPETNVLVTRFEGASGTIDLTDCLAIRSTKDETPGEGQALHALVRRVRCTAGAVDIDVTCDPRPDYGHGAPAIEASGSRWLIGDAGARLVLESSIALAQQRAEGLQGHALLKAGEEACFVLRYGGGESRLPDPLDVPAAIEAAVRFWRDWSAQFQYDGVYRDAVLRSALVLKGLMFAPTGAIAAAPTTSLPEWFGGKRNWDYRYSWLRDSTLTLYALDELGYGSDAASFHRWLMQAANDEAADMKIVYSIHAKEIPAEQTLDHLTGFRGSQPVRIGNGARNQKQLDVFGEILDAAFFAHKRGSRVPDDYWEFLVQLANFVCDHWREPDHGIWEMRTEPRQFVYSKVLCWVCLNRAIRMAQERGMEPPQRWSEEMDAIHEDVLRNGYNAEVGAFVQSYGSKYLDASNLALPLLGFISATDPRMAATIRLTEKQLMEHGVVLRYRDADDGLEGREGGFLVCCFWLIGALIMLGDLDKARHYFEKMLGYANDVGLLSEEVDGESGDLLGNFPQAFSHLGLITSAVSLNGAPPNRRHLARRSS